MNDRERLIEMFLDYEKELNSVVFDRERLADYLIANGVVVQKQGCWKKTWIDGEDMFGKPCKILIACNCSICGAHADGLPFCPFCGAKMEVE